MQSLLLEQCHLQQSKDSSEAFVKRGRQVNRPNDAFPRRIRLYPNDMSGFRRNTTASLRVGGSYRKSNVAVNIPLQIQSVVPETNVDIISAVTIRIGVLVIAPTGHKVTEAGGVGADPQWIWRRIQGSHQRLCGVVDGPLCHSFTLELPPNVPKQQTTNEQASC